MPLSIDNLVDGCLLHIFDFLDPFTWVSVAQVCTRWKRIVQRRLEKITDISLNDPLLCDGGHYPEIKKHMIQTNIETIKTVLQFIGPQVKSVKLGDCKKLSIFLNQRYGYRFTCKNEVKLYEIISLLRQTCENIVTLHFADPYAMQTTLKSQSDSKSHTKSDSETDLKSDTKPKWEFPPPVDSMPAKFEKQLIKSSKNCKNVILSEGVWDYLAKCTTESVEELTWKLSLLSKFHTSDKLEPFPNLRKLTLYAQVPFDYLEYSVGAILKFYKHIKALTVISYTGFFKKTNVKMLSDISALSHLEELEFRNEKRTWENAELDRGSVEQLLERCQNLRIVKFDQIKLGKTDVSSFFTLPKLEELYISDAKYFGSEFVNKIESIQNLVSLYIEFVPRKSLNLSALCDAIKKMPALKNLIIKGLTKKQAIEFTCKVIENRVVDTDIIVRTTCAGSKQFRVHNDGNQKLRPEPLWLGIRSQGKEYQDKVDEFVQSLGNCSISFDGEMTECLYEGVTCEELKTTFYYCDCYSTGDDDYITEEEPTSSESDDGEERGCVIV